MMGGGGLTSGTLSICMDLDQVGKDKATERIPRRFLEGFGFFFFFSFFVLMEFVPVVKDSCGRDAISGHLKRVESENKIKRSK